MLRAGYVNGSQEPERPGLVGAVCGTGGRQRRKTDQSHVQVLGLLPGDPKAEEAALKALGDDKPDVRSAAAQALGDMKAKSAIARLYEMFTDKDVGVIISAAHALLELGDNRGYNVYYAVLTGERKSGASLLDEQKKMLNDPKKMAQFGFEQGIGFIPFAGLGYGAFKMVTKDTTSPVLAAAALTLVKDPDPKSGDALSNAASYQQELDRPRSGAECHRAAGRDLTAAGCRIGLAG